MEMILLRVTLRKVVLQGELTVSGWRKAERVLSFVFLHVVFFAKLTVPLIMNSGTFNY